MAINTPNRVHYQDALRQLAEQLDQAAHGEKAALKQDFMERYDVSRVTLYRHLQKIAGWSSERKRRRDAGSTAQDEETIVELAAFLREHMRKNGKQTMHITTARSILENSGRTFNVTNGRLAQLLRQLNMDFKSHQRPTASQSIVSLHPNHMHEADPSLCLLYYTPQGGQKVLQDDEIYKNKPEWVNRVGNLKCWRYVLTDHYSATIIVRYYQARGETQDNMYDFLLYCWKKMDGRPFHGVPKILYTDPGSAHTAGGMQNALKSLGVDYIAHKAGNARATGSVEIAQQIVETQFESRLLTNPVKSVDELNKFAEWWYNAYNANTIPHYDSRLTRRGLAKPTERYGIWQTIRENQLAYLPDMALCRYLMVNDPVEVRVSQHLEVPFKFPGDKRRTFWDVSHIPGLFVDQTVIVQPLIMTRQEACKQIMVTVVDYQGNKSVFTAAPVNFDAISGIKQSGAIAGEEFKSMPDSDVDIAATRMARAAYPDMSLDEIEKQRKKRAAPFKDIDSLEHLKSTTLPSYMDRKGVEIPLQNKLHVAPTPMDIIDVATALTRQHGITMDAGRYQQIADWYPDGVMHDQLDELAKRLFNPQTQLRVVGGDNG